MAILPTRILEVEFDTGVWTNITADMVELSTRRGRNRESGAFETGQLVFTVRNDTRKYDPDNAAGPYYGKLRPNRRVRLRATYNAVTYPVFQGYIDRIAQIYGGPNDATAEFQVSDLFKILNRVELPSSAYAVEVAAATPVRWWRLGEPSGATSAADAMGTVDRLTAVNSPTFGQASLQVRDPDTAVSFATASDGLQGIFANGTFPLTTAGTIEFWYRKDAASNDPMVGLYVFAPTPYGVDPVVDANGALRFFLINSAGTNYDVTTTGVDVNDLITHHIALTWAAGSAIKIYVDGVDRTAAAVVFAGTMADPGSNKWAVLLNALDYPPFVSVGFGSKATYDELAIYNTALSGATVAAHNAAGRTPWTGDLPGPRLSRVAAAAGITDLDLDVGTTTLQATSLGGDALSYAQKVEETELGRLFVARNGNLTFVSRENSVAEYATSLATLVDDDSGAGLPYRFVSSDVDEARIVTRATVSREGSIALTYQDSAAITEFKIVDETHDGLLHASDDYSLAYAQWIVNTHKTPSSRIGTITLELAKDPATLYPGILALELGDRVTYKRKPQNVGAVISIDMRVEAIGHATGPHYWRTQLFLSPLNLAAGGQPVGVWDTSLWDQAVWSI